MLLDNTPAKNVVPEAVLELREATSREIEDGTTEDETLTDEGDEEEEFGTDDGDAGDEDEEVAGVCEGLMKKRRMMLDS